MKKAFIFAFIFTMIATVSHAQMINIDVVLGNKPPAPNEAQMMQVEEQKHPNIVKAMHDIEASMRALHEAPDDFGGRKAQAETDLRQAYMSLRKALYFRLYKERQERR